MRMIGHRLAPDEFRRPRGVVKQTPMAAHGTFKRALPRLIERLDHIDAEIVAFGERQYILNHTRLVGRRRLRALAHTTGARPADLPDDYFLTGKGGYQLAVDRVDMGGGAAR